MCLFLVLRGGGGDEARLAVRVWRHHPGIALHYWTEDMLRLEDTTEQTLHQTMNELLLLVMCRVFRVDTFLTRNNNFSY